MKSKRINPKTAFAWAIKLPQTRLFFSRYDGYGPIQNAALFKNRKVTEELLEPYEEPVKVQVTIKEI